MDLYRQALSRINTTLLKERYTSGLGRRARLGTWQAAGQVAIQAAGQAAGQAALQAAIQAARQAARQAVIQAT